MIKVKDGYAKLVGATASGSASHILLSNGGVKAVSDFAAASALDNYLPLSGGTISGSLVIQASSPGVTFKKSNESNPFASLGIYSNKLSMYVNSENKYYDILHSGNYSSYALPLSGGTIAGGHGDYTPLIVETNSLPEVWMKFKDTVGNTYIGSDKGQPAVYIEGDHNYLLLHSGNYSQYALPLTGGTINGTNTEPLMINTTSATSSIMFQRNSVNNAQVGWDNGLGAFLANIASGYAIGVKDDGTPIFYNGSSKTLIHSGNIGSLSVNYAANADKLDGLHLYSPGSGTGGVAYIGGDGVMEVSSIIDFHSNNSDGNDFNTRLYSTGSYKNQVQLPTSSGTLALTTDNVASANVLATSYSENINYGTFHSALKLIYNTKYNDYGFPNLYVSGLSVMTGYTGWQLLSYGGGEENPYFRSLQDTGTWKPWRKLAFLDDNVASATKLHTARMLWGQSFDGTGDISGSIDNCNWIRYYKGGSVSGYIVGRGEEITGGDGLGLWTYGNTPIFLGTGSRQRMTIDSSGNVGIGTTSPISKLHLYSTDNTTLRIQSDGSGGDQGAICMKKASGNGLVFAVENRDFIWQVGASSATGDGTERMRLTNSGNVGIGTTSPSYKLDVNGNIAATSSVNSVRLIPDADCGIFMKSNGQWLHVAGSGSKMFIYNGEWDSKGQGNYNKGIVINTSNNVGIGTESPVHKLDVNGSIYGSHYYGDAITLYTRGNGTYTRAWITAKDSAGDFIIEAPLTAESSGTRAPITLTWRGGYPSMGGLKITGYSEAVLGGNKIWHAGNDGSGSGLDADLLDGKHLSSFITYELSTDYVGASFNSEDLSKKAASTYIEYWDGAGGWFNSRWGLVLAISGFHRVGSSDSYVLLGGGGHKAVSDFATASHNHNGSYVYTGGMVNGAYAVIPTYNGETGWHRIATIDGGTGYGSWILYLCGDWSWASNTNAILHINTMHTAARITQVSGIVGFVTDVRLVPISANNYYVDVYINYSGANTPGTVYCYFLGNGAITTRTTAEKITASVSTAASITLVTGTKTNDSSYAAHFYENSDIRYKTIINNLAIKANQLANLPLFDFKWLDNEDLLNTGTSAQAVQELLPYIVSGTDKLTLDYGVLGTIAGITACRELTEQEKEINGLKEQIKFLKDEINNLKTNKLWQS